MIEQIYLYLILVGVTIGAVLAALRYQARSASRVNLALIRLNEQQSFDTLAFLRNAWPLLEQAGLKGMTWRLDWFGAIVEGQAGVRQGRRNQREIRIADMQLTVELFQHKRRGERRYFEATLIETFLLLLRTDMLIKANATDATFAQMSKLHLFLQHDMKNIAQFVQLMADQLAFIPAGKEQKFLDYLRIAAPLARQRADHIVHTLTVGQSRDVPDCGLELRDQLEQLCRMHSLEYTIVGSAKLNAPPDSLDRALDNIIKNYSDLRASAPDNAPCLKIAITQDGLFVNVTIEATNLPAPRQPERLFEPFWSNKPDGLGIGLYQAKQLLETAGGTLRAVITPAGQLQFQIAVPLPENNKQAVSNM